MICNLIILLLLVFSFNDSVNAFVTSFDHDLLLSSVDRPVNKNASDEQVLKQFEQYLILNQFLKPGFSQSHKFYGPDENEEENNFSIQSDFEKEYVSNLMLKEVAKLMSDQNVFKLKEFLKREYHQEINKEAHSKNTLENKFAFKK